MHCNFSTEKLREEGGKEYFDKLMASFEKNCMEHIAVYGPDNDQRLTGLHETQSIDKFSWGIGNRGASFRIPTQTMHDNGKGYIEDRRPASNIDPYVVGAIMLDTSCLAQSKADDMINHYAHWKKSRPNLGIQ
jgi:glutamine synthetase